MCGNRRMVKLFILLITEQSTLHSW